MPRTVVVPPTGLRPGIPCSPAIRRDKLLLISGQTGSDPVTRALPARAGLKIEIDMTAVVKDGL
jgi:enamine deaminase RidA (YjgF/YER057c/UK114 family)